MLLHHPLHPRIQQHIYEAYYRFITAHKSEPKDEKFDNDKRALTVEQTNIQTILMGGSTLDACWSNDGEDV
jgi:hypothetical protein